MRAREDLGFGLQAFGGLDWRWRSRLLGASVKYQYLLDVIAIDYSNLRLTGQIGWTF